MGVYQIAVTLELEAATAGWALLGAEAALKDLPASVRVLDLAARPRPVSGVTET